MKNIALKNHINANELCKHLCEELSDQLAVKDLQMCYQQSLSSRLVFSFTVEKTNVSAAASGWTLALNRLVLVQPCRQQAPPVCPEATFGYVSVHCAAMLYNLPSPQHTDKTLEMPVLISLRLQSVVGALATWLGQFFVILQTEQSFSLKYLIIKIIISDSAVKP